jgi:GntR family transcriptional regulator
MSRVTRKVPTFSPLYQQIKEHMINSLEAGEWRPGEMIPSEAELAVRFQVSQGTVRKAIDELAQENFLIRRQGKGTFVATHEDPRSFYRFLRLMPDRGEAKQAKSVPITCEMVPASEDVCHVLQVALGASVLHITRLLTFDAVSVVYDDIFLDAALFPGLELKALQTSNSSLYSFFEAGFDVQMIRAEERLRAVAATAASAQALSVPVGSPLLLVERVAFTYGDRPVEWRRGFYLTENHHYLNLLG